MSSFQVCFYLSSRVVKGKGQERLGNTDHEDIQSNITLRHYTCLVITVATFCRKIVEKPQINQLEILFSNSYTRPICLPISYSDVLMRSAPPSPLLLSAPIPSPLLSCLDHHLLAPQSPPHPAKGPPHWLWSRHSFQSQVPERPRSCMTMMPTMPVSFPCWLMRYGKIF